MVESKGEMREYYYERAYPEFNGWRVAIDKEVEEVRLVFMEEMEDMKKNSKKMKREEFILYSSYSDFFGESTKKDATKKVARNEKQMSSEDSKKRKQTP